MGAKNNSNEISFTRVYDAPVSLVWEAWTDPKKAAKWWGPRGWSITTHSKDLKVGGIWHYTMHGPNGENIPQKTVYHDVVTESRLVYDHGGFDDREPLFRVHVTFNEVKGKTKMDMTMTFASPEKAMEIGKFIKQASGYSTWDRLGEYLGKETKDKEQFIINRSFEAPINVVYDMWTNPKHFAKWLGPTGATMQFIRADIKAGGNSFYMMTTDSGVTMYGNIKYLELHKPDLIVYTQQFSDRDEKMSRHPMMPTWPATMLTVVQLVEEVPGRTRVTVTWEPHGDFTAEEMATFVKERAGMTQGWTGSFDKLEDYIAQSI
jgi:uncharacterized protein YndB with AHSA1/START domain